MARGSPRRPCSAGSRGRTGCHSADPQILQSGIRRAVGGATDAFLYSDRSRVVALPPGERHRIRGSGSRCHLLGSAVNHSSDKETIGPQACNALSFRVVRITRRSEHFSQISLQSLAVIRIGQGEFDEGLEVALVVTDVKSPFAGWQRHADTLRSAFEQNPNRVC